MHYVGILKGLHNGLLVTYQFHSWTKTQNCCFTQFFDPDAEPASYLMGTARFFPGVQQPRHLAGYSPPPSADVIV